MDYLYWTFTFFLVSILLLISRKVSHIKKGALLIAWKIALLRTLIPIKIPIQISAYNLIKSKAPIGKYLFLNAEYAMGSSYIIHNDYGTSIHNLIMGLMLFGAVLILVYSVIVIGGLYRIIKSSDPIEDSTTIAWARNSARGKKIHILKSPAIHSPMSCNLFFISYIIVPPKIYYNAYTAGIYEHEINHINKYDTAWKFLSHVALLLHWFNPIVWIFCSSFNLQLELACDEVVIQNRGIDYRSCYSRLLLDFSSNHSSDSPSSLFSSFKANSHIQERVRFIMLFKTQSRPFILCTAIVFSILTVSLSTNSFSAGIARQPVMPEAYEIFSYERVGAIDDTPRMSEHKLLLSGGLGGEHDIVPGDRVIYSTDNGTWDLLEGEEIQVVVDIVNRHFESGQKIEIGYILNDQVIPFFSEQIGSGASIRFAVPQDGDYLFYIDGRSSHTIMIESLSFK